MPKKELKYTKNPDDFENFIKHLQCDKLKEPLSNTLANIFSMRFIGNKTHGDMAEVGLTEFINQFMYDFECKHVGKEFFRSKEHEEDIAVHNHLQESNDVYLPISLKAYGVGPLQLSTDKENVLYNFLKDELAITDTSDTETLQKVIKKIGSTVMFNVLPLIYKENSDETEGGVCNILLFNSKALMKNLARIVYIEAGKEYNFKQRKVQEKTGGKQRKHPIFMLLDSENNYICEIRYGGADANALQRGFWSKTTNKKNLYFIELFPKWIKYEKRQDLITLMQRALNCTQTGHKKANEVLLDNIVQEKQRLDIKN